MEYKNTKLKKEKFKIVHVISTSIPKFYQMALKIVICKHNAFYFG